MTDAKGLRAELVERAYAIGPVLADGVEQGDRERRLPAATVAAVDESGVARLWTARTYGGFQAGVRTLSEVTRVLAGHCPSTAWVVNNINGSNLLAARFPRRTRDEIFGGNPRARLASVFVAPGDAVRVDGGYLLSGRWPYASGILHDDWAILSAKDGDSGQALSMVVPETDWQVDETWATVGMRATGSHTVVLDRVFVPGHHAIDVADQLGRANATDVAAPALFRTAAVAAMAVICASVVVGIAQAARDHVVALAPRRGLAPTSYTNQAASPAFRTALGETALKVDAAQMHLDRAADVLDEAAEAAVALPETELRRIRGDVGQAAKLTTVAMDELMWAHGAASFAESSPMQQLWRDANTAARHAMLNVQVGRELYGGALVGADSIVPSL